MERLERETGVLLVDGENKMLDYEKCEGDCGVRGTLAKISIFLTLTSPTVSVVPTVSLLVDYVESPVSLVWSPSLTIITMSRDTREDVANLFWPQVM